MNFLGLIIAVATFLVIGIFHPIVIKSEYHLGTRCWWVFLVAGVAFIVASLFTANDVLSPILGVVGCSCLWSILELFEQKKRVERGWFPMNPTEPTTRPVSFSSMANTPGAEKTVRMISRLSSSL